VFGEWRRRVEAVHGGHEGDATKKSSQTFTDIATYTDIAGKISVE
jgi:hypothetical protein